MTSLSSAELTTTFRPIVHEAERVLARQFSAGAQVPIVPVPRLEAEEGGRGRNWVAEEIDWQGLRRLAISAMSRSSNVFVAEAIIAQALDLGPHEQGAERSWTPQGQIVDAFLVDYFRRAYGDATGEQMPDWLGEPEDAALEGAADRLASFLTIETFTGAVVAPLRDLDFAGDVIDFDADVRLLLFSPARKDEFWRRFGHRAWPAGGMDPHLILTATHLIEGDVAGQKLRGWDWAAGDALIDRAVMALRINAGGSVAAPNRLLALPDQFDDYLALLGAGGGLLTQPATGRGRRGALDADAAAEVSETYRRLGSVDHMSSMGLALRRFAASSERLSDEDRLVDAWIAFESLFAPDHTAELRFRASLRIARFVGTDHGERTDLFNGLKRSYDWRSRIVHGAGTTGKRAKGLGSLQETVELTDELLRRALRRGLEVAPNLEEIDRALLE